MESKKQVGSSSSFPSDLFGNTKESQTASMGAFASIFLPPSTVLGRNPSSSEVIGSWQKQASGYQEWNTKKGSPAKSGEVVGSNFSDRTRMFQDERPYALSSSLYYGGQDVYSQSASTQTTGSYPIYKKDREGDDPNGNNQQGASRGNWWEGSLYY